MIPGSSGSKPKIRVDRAEIRVSPLAPGPVREELVVMNEGKGRLYGNIRSEDPWVTVLDTTISTTFIQRIILEIRPEKAPFSGESSVHILSTGGIARIKVGLLRTPVPGPTFQMDEKVFSFCGITNDETISFSLTVRNTGPGFLSGTAVPLCDWIEVPVRGIWTRTVQVIQVKIITSKAPQARHPVGRIHVRTNGGEETVEVSIHRSHEKGPVARFTPSSLRISWSVRGIIEERLVIRNTGAGTLRGTIPTKYPWVTAIPSIFSVQDTGIITIRVDTRLLPGTVPASVPLVVITNAGSYTVNLEITRAYQAQVKPRIRLPRVKTRTRMTVIDPHGESLQVISSGKSGGEGEIWYIEGDDSRCVKIFHPHRSSLEMEEKIRVMQKSPLFTPPGTGICWPAGAVRSSSSPQRFLGYLMPRLDECYSPVHAWYDKPDQEMSRSLLAAGRLAALVSVVHASGHCIGDLRENNVFINTSGEICLIDTDSFQITDPASSQTWFCRVGTGEYLPPELIDGSFEKQNIDRLFADRFALAVLIFRFLMQGAHPYQGRGPLIEDAPTTPDKIIRGLFAYEGKIPGLYPPEYAPPYERISPAIRALFHEAFVTGHQHPQTRPEPSRWAQVLGIRKSPDFRQCTPVPVISVGVQSESVIPAPVRPAWVDDEGKPLIVKERKVRITHGEIRATDRTGFQILIGRTGFSPLVSGPARPDLLPPSVIVPSLVVYEQHAKEKTTRYLIPEIDFSRYVHWHIAADPASRKMWRGKSFSFRYRVAACRNLLSALLSIHWAGLTPMSLTFRFVFVGPDSSVRIIAVPQRPAESQGKEMGALLADARNLICMMLMDGCHLDYFLWNKRRDGYHYVPSPECIPFPLRKIFNFSPSDTASLIETLKHWFSLSEQAFLSLIPCRVDSDHWYCLYPGTCPFCMPERPGVFRLPAGPVLLRLSAPVMLLIAPPVQTIRHLRRRGQRQKRASIPIIILPSSLTLPRQLTGCRLYLLSARNTDTCFLPVCQMRNLPVVIRPLQKALVVIPNKSVREDPLIFNLPYISLIDEMRWVSSLEQMKGTFFPRLVRRKLARRQYVQKTFSVMIFPGYFGASEKPVPSKGKKEKKERRSGKLSKKLSEFFDEFLA